MIRKATYLALLALAGCSSTADQTSSAFVDPARYALYDCNQLATEYRTVVERENELRGLMDKARQGVAGPLMAEVGYSADYLTTHGRRQGIEEAARRDNCNLSQPPAKRGGPPPRVITNEGPR